jgi:hypothetical protein
MLAFAFVYAFAFVGHFGIFQAKCWEVSGGGVCANNQRLVVVGC